MPTLTIELPSQEAQRAFNERRWTELLSDPLLARIEGRIETDRHGHVVMTPPPGARHGMFQAEIVYQLRNRIANGRVLTECPISTADGVRATDVAWASDATIRELAGGQLFLRAPDICVEVLSPDNTEAEMREKRALYFDAGAKEVWICAESGAMTFFQSGGRHTPSSGSQIFPEFPKQISLL